MSRKTDPFAVEPTPELILRAYQAGIFLMAAGGTMFITEFWRDPLGRGAVFHGILKSPQIAGIVLVLAGAAVLLERKSERITQESLAAQDAPPAPPLVQDPSHE